jgi:hypothetical protein
MSVAFPSPGHQATRPDGGGLQANPSPALTARTDPALKPATAMVNDAVSVKTSRDLDQSASAMTCLPPDARI